MIFADELIINFHILYLVNMTPIYEIDYYGFVYIWYDRKRKMSYIGSHFGPIDDGYTGSSLRFRRALNKRPNDFRRRILAYIKTHDRKALLQEEERWLHMIKPSHLQKRYYNVKRRGTGGFVTEGYTIEQRKAYIEKLRNRKNKGAQHYAARKCFCVDTVYDTITDAKRTLGWDPIRRIHSRLYTDFYYIDEGQPTEQEIEKNTAKMALNKQRSINAMRARNLSLPSEHHKQRIAKAIATKARRNGKWICPAASRKGRKISIDNVVYNNIVYATSITGLSTYIIRRRAKDDNDATCFFVAD
jgi:hypothetical protein